MAQIDITMLSSKGQVVIPSEMRGDLREGDRLLVIKSRDRIILKKADKFDKNLKEELEFARRTEKAWKEIESGKGKKMTLNDFLEEIRSL